MSSLLYIPTVARKMLSQRWIPVLPSLNTGRLYQARICNVYSISKRGMYDLHLELARMNHLARGSWGTKSTDWDHGQTRGLIIDGVRNKKNIRAIINILGYSNFKDSITNIKILFITIYVYMDILVHSI
jgi:hypothetical protein